MSQLRKHPLYRALRADKLALAALEKTLESFSRERSTEEVPVLRMLALSKTDIETRAKAVIESYRKGSNVDPLDIQIQDGESAIGGGAGPNTYPATSLLSVSHVQHSADQIEEALRLSNPPIISRIAEGQVLLDLRSVEPCADQEIVAALQSVSK